MSGVGTQIGRGAGNPNNARKHTITEIQHKAAIIQINQKVGTNKDKANWGIPHQAMPGKDEGKESGSQRCFQHVLSLIFCNTTLIENCVSRTLASNMEICKLLTDMRGSKCCFHDTKFVQLHKQPNYFALLPSEYLSTQIDLRKPDNHIYCTQYSDLWWELRGTALLTGSMIMKVFGFDTLKAEKQHVNIYVKKRPAPDFTDEVKKYIQFRKENEVHAISILVGLILPALKTKCYSFYEVAPQFIQGRNRLNLIEVSADGNLHAATRGFLINTSVL